MLSDDEVTAIEQMERAVPIVGEWEACDTANSDFVLIAGKREVIAYFDCSTATADFIAQSRTEIPRLLRDWRAMKKVVDAARMVADAGAISVYSYTGPVGACRKALAELDAK